MSKKKIIRFSLFLLSIPVILGVLVYLIRLTPGKHPDSRFPNVILILCDTLRADHLSCYGYHRTTSPFIDSLKTRGLFFKKCYSNASRTGPSISSLFTSLYPISHGAVNSLESWDLKAVLDEKNVTMAEILRKNGFYTHAVFSNVNASPEFGYAQGFKSHSFDNYQSAQKVRLSVIKILKKLKRKKPFFLYLHFMDPHNPYKPPEPFDNYFDPDYQGMIEDDKPGLFDDIMSENQKLSPRDLSHISAQYDAEILYFDRELQSLFQSLDSMGLIEDSVIIFTADHGEEFYEHGKFLHGYTLYQEQLHVPLIILGKDIPVKKISVPVSLLDLLPTLLSWMNIEIKTDRPFQGRDITPLFKGDTLPPPILFAEASLNAVFTIKYKTIIKEDWKYIYDFLHDSEELYNLETDPGEQSNLVSHQVKQLAIFRQEMQNFLRMAPGEIRQKFVPLDKKSREQLKNLGYIQ